MRRRRRAGMRGMGFTLIEVLLVVAILGILATAAVVNFGGFLGDARASATRQSIQQSMLAIKTYKIARGENPSGWEDLLRETDNYEAPFDAIPQDGWGTPLQMKKISKFKYEVRSAGEDKQFGTSDDLTP